MEMDFLQSKCIFVKEEESKVNLLNFDLQALHEHYISHNKAKLVPAGNLVSVSVKEGYQGDVKQLPCGARSLLVHPETGRIYARGVNKFFSLSELAAKRDFRQDWWKDAALWGRNERHFKVYVQRKIAGFAISVFSEDGERLSIMSKHSVDGPHVEIARGVLYSSTSSTQRQSMAYHLHAWNATASCECICLAKDYLHPVLEDERFDNRLVLFSIQLSQLAERSIDPKYLPWLARLWGLECVPQLRIGSQKELVEIIFSLSTSWSPTILWEKSEKKPVLDTCASNSIQTLPSWQRELAEGIVLVFAEEIPKSISEFRLPSCVEGLKNGDTPNTSGSDSYFIQSCSATGSSSSSSDTLCLVPDECWMRVIRLKVKTLRYICMRNFRSLLRRESHCQCFLMHYVLVEWATGSYNNSLPFESDEEELAALLERCGVQILWDAFFSYMSRHSRFWYRDALWSVGKALNHLLAVTIREGNQEHYAPITLVILCGLPGSGKSTFAKALLQDLGFRNSVYSVAVHISRDRIYQRITQKIFGECRSGCSPSKHQLRRVEQKVHTETVLSLRRAIQLSMLTEFPVFVVLDACNSTPSARSYWRSILPPAIHYSAIVHVYCSDRSELQRRLLQRASHERLSHPDVAQRALYAVEKNFVQPPSVLLPTQGALEESNIPVYHFDTVSACPSTNASASYLPVGMPANEGMKQLNADLLKFRSLGFPFLQRNMGKEGIEHKWDPPAMVIMDEKDVECEIEARKKLMCSSLLNIETFSPRTRLLLSPSSYSCEAGKNVLSSSSAWSIQLQLFMGFADLQSIGASALSAYLKWTENQNSKVKKSAEETFVGGSTRLWFRAVRPHRFFTKLKERVTEMWRGKESDKRFPGMISSTICAGQPYWLKGWLSLDGKRAAHSEGVSVSSSPIQERFTRFSSHPNQHQLALPEKLEVTDSFALLSSALLSRFSEMTGQPHVTLYYSKVKGECVNINRSHDIDFKSGTSSKTMESIDGFLRSHNLYLGKIIEGEITDLLIDRFAWVFKVRLIDEKGGGQQNSGISASVEWVNQLECTSMDASEAKGRVSTLPGNNHVCIPLHITLGTAAGVPFSYAGEMFSKFEKWQKENIQLASAQKSLTAKRSRQKYHNFLHIQLSSPIPFSGTVISKGL